MKIDGNAKKPIQIQVKLAKLQEEKLVITTPFIKLDAALKLCGIAQTGGHAKILIQEENSILVNGELCTQRGKKLVPGDKLQYKRQLFEVSS